MIFKYIEKTKDTNKRNLHVQLFKKTKGEFYNNLKLKAIPDKRLFWKILLLYFINRTLEFE